VHQGLKGLQTHATNDSTLPFQASGWCKGLLEQGGCALRFEQHSDGHSLGPARVINAMCEFWASLC
jgi:predicted esterase